MLHFPNRDADIRIAPDVLDPTGGFVMFGEKVELLVVDDEPNLDFAVAFRSPDRLWSDEAPAYPPGSGMFRNS